MGSKADKRHPLSLLKKRSSLRSSDGRRFEQAPNQVPAKFLTSYRTYRNESGLIKYGWRILIVALLLPNLPQALELKGVLGVNRILVEPDTNLTQITVTKGARCGPQTQELALVYSEVTAPVAKQLADSVALDHPAFKPCDQAAIHNADGSFRLVFAYKMPAGKSLQFQKSESSHQVVIDHWIGNEAKAVKSTNRAPSSKPNAEVPKYIENLNDLAKIQNVELRSFTNFESPYRDASIEKNPGINSTPLKSRPLQIPILQFRIGPTDVNFEAQEFPYKEFQLAQIEMSNALRNSIDVVVEMAKREDWIRASASNDILLSSKLGKEYKTIGHFVPAFSGLLKIKSSQTGKETQNTLFSGGINVWRETLLRQAVKQEKSDPFLDFMYLESLRYLYEERDYYTGLALIDESKGIKWSPAVLERSDYLQAVALLSLGMRQKAKEAFTKYLDARKKMNIKDISDRRLLPSAAFRLADVDFVREDYPSALKSYEDAMKFLPGSSNVNLEGYIYPRTLVSFPHVLFNMAEAHIRVGDYAKALKRLRALIAFDVVGTNHGIALYRIGELLSSLGSSPEKVSSIFRECSYRYDGYLSGSLCQIRSTVMEPQNFNRSLWPRVEASFSKFEKTEFRSDQTNLTNEDRKMYASLVKAMFYIERQRPMIALSVLDATRDLESSNYLKNWNFEYSGSAFLGVLKEYMRVGDYKSVIQGYEKRRKTQLLYVERPGIALAAARAYADQGLWTESNLAFERADKLKNVIALVEPRPFDYTKTDWVYTEAQIAVGLYDEGKLSRLEAESELKKLDDTHVPSLMLLVGFAQKSNNLELEARGWKRLAETTKLEWSQVRSYSSALLKSAKNQELRNLLEEYVGTWFYEKDKSVSSSKSKPESTLILRLAEARIRDGAKDSGIRVFEYLTRLDTKELDASTPKEMIFYSMGKAQVSKKDYLSARRSFDAATELAPTSVWGRLAATENQDLASKASEARAR